MTRDEAAGVLIAKVIEREGGVADIGDGAGITRWGQTPGWLAQFTLPVPTTMAEAVANYRTWLVRTKLIAVCDEADSFADAVVDFAVNAGHQTAIKVLQKALRLSADGVIGPETEAAIGRLDRPQAARTMLAGRLRFYGGIITSAPDKHARWAKGWLNRVAAQVEALV